MGDKKLNKRQMPIHVLPDDNHNYGIVTPVVSPEVAGELFRNYQQLESEILEESDFMFYVTVEQSNGKEKSYSFSSKKKAEDFAKEHRAEVTKRKKKSAYRKMGVFFNLTFTDVKSLEDLNCEISQIGDLYIYRYIAKGFVLTVTKQFRNNQLITLESECTILIYYPRTGRTVIGASTCSRNEKQYWSAAERDIPATAATRAFNRGISDMIGWGEVSAEELTITEDGQVAENTPEKSKEKAKSKNKKSEISPKKQIGELLLKFSSNDIVLASTNLKKAIEYHNQKSENGQIDVITSLKQIPNDINIQRQIWTAIKVYIASTQQQNKPLDKSKTKKSAPVEGCVI